jgi:endonuclease III
MERSLADIVERLREVYGTPRAEVTDPFEMILLENVAYLVDDARRLETFERLRDEIGLAPKAILAASPEKIARVIAGGGMKPEMRATKVIDCARLAQTIGVSRAGVPPAVAAASSPPRDRDGHAPAGVDASATYDKKILRKYPGVGEPLADKILLFNGKQRTLAPDSNALRVLLRLGFGTESKNYAASYKSAVAAAGELPNAKEAHILLRRHGQEVCKRSAPRCEVCVVRADCDFYSNLMARSRV